MIQVLGQRILLHNARIIDPATDRDLPVGWVLVEGGTIVDSGAGEYTGFTAQSIDCRGKILCPGLIDSRVHLGEPGAEHKETIAGACRTAVASGVTTLIALPDTDPPIDSVELLEFVARRARRQQSAKVFSHATVTKGLNGRDMAEMGLLAEAGAVAFSDGGNCVADAAVMRRALAYAGTWDLLLCQHPEEPSLAKDGQIAVGEVALRLGLKGIPAEAEAMLLDRDFWLLRMTGARYHAARISTRMGVDALRRAKQEGLKVSADTAPAYFLMSTQDIGDWRTFAKLSPPLRSQEDRAAVIEGLADGTIDIIASDHRPQDQDVKRLPFGQAAFGAVGIDTLLPLVLKLVKSDHLSLQQALATVTINPAKRYGLTSGRLAKGAPADLLVFDEDRAWRIDESTLLSASKNTPFDRHPVEGRALLTVVDGRVVHDRLSPKSGSRP